MKDYTTQYSPTTIHNFIRAMQPWPQAWTTVKLNKNDKDTKRLKLLRSHLEDSETQQAKSDTKTLVLDKVQLEGKTPVSWEQFKEGYSNFVFSK